MENLDDSFELYLHEIGRYPLLSKQREIELAAEIAKHNQKAAEELFVCNLRFVVSRARHYQLHYFSVQDLTSEGNIGLWKAVWKYNPYHNYETTQKTVRFSTCARWWVDQSILRAIQTFGQYANYPAGVGTEVGKVLRAYREQDSDGSYDLDAIASATTLDRDDIANIVAINLRVISLDAPFTEDGETMQDIIPDRRTEQQPVSAPSAMLGEALSTLTPVERQVIMLEFGFYGRDYRQHEIAAIIGKTTTRVRQIKTQALAKLRQHPQWRLTVAPHP